MSKAKFSETRKAKWRAAWKNARCWLLWWKIDPMELRSEVKGYASINRFLTARGVGFLVSLLLGVPKLILGVTMLIATPKLLWMLFIGELGSPLVSCPLAEGLAFSLLGCFLFKGKPPAILGMMLWWTLYLIMLNIRLFYDASPALEMSVFLFVSLLGWGCFMHVLLTALRVESERTRAA